MGEEMQLLETLLWQPASGYVLLARHADRLEASAATFGFPFVRTHFLADLAARAHRFEPAPQRVRVILDAQGCWTVTSTPVTLPSSDAVLSAVISPKPVHREDLYLYHKTTRRTLYESELARLHAKTGCDEVLFLNERGELCEGSRTNLFVALRDRLVTPPVSCGLLPGTLRAELLATRPAGEIAEGVLFPTDLVRAGGFFLGNSVRGLLTARLMPQAPA